MNETCECGNWYNTKVKCPDCKTTAKEVKEFHCIKCIFWTTNKEKFGEHIKQCKGLEKGE